MLRERKSVHSLCGGSSSSNSHSSTPPGSDKSKQGKGIRAATLARLTKLKLHKTGPNTKHREKARQYLTERHALSLHDSSSAGTRPRKPKPKREAHSEGETLTDDEQPDSDFKSTVARLKKVSLRRFRVWKS